MKIPLINPAGYYVVPMGGLTRSRRDRRLLRGHLFPLGFRGTMSCAVMRWRFVEDLRDEIVAPERRPLPSFDRRARNDGLR